MNPITLTIDLEDPTEAYNPKGRYVEMTGQILNLCKEKNVRATFFVVGKVARAAPDLVRKIAQHGHEIAYHSHGHLPLTQDSPGRLVEETAADKRYIEDLIGKPLLGYRAPCFSLTPQTRWATDALRELGFLYSSSIMPTNVSRFGYSGAPHAPFLWPSGLMEFPLPMARLGRFYLPYSGGIYLYSWPQILVNRFLAKANRDEILWTYTHPQDFDTAEPFKSLPNTPLWVSLILWLKREAAQKRITALLSRYEVGKPLGEIAQGFIGKSLPVHDAV